MKWRTASISLMTLTLLLIGGTVVKTLCVSYPKSSELFSDKMNKSNIQLGYYDLLSKNSELYNPHFTISKDTIVLKLSNPDDNRLQIKIRMSLKKATSQGLLYSYKQVFISKKNTNLLIASTMGYLEHDSIVLDSVAYPGGKVTITSSGQIISHI